MVKEVNTRFVDPSPLEGEDVADQPFEQGYYSHPSLSHCGQWVAFTCEDDIWVARMNDAIQVSPNQQQLRLKHSSQDYNGRGSLAIARRITGGGGGGHGGRSRWPLFSPCGTRLAFTCSSRYVNSNHIFGSDGDVSVIGGMYHSLICFSSPSPSKM